MFSGWVVDVDYEILLMPNHKVNWIFSRKSFLTYLFTRLSLIQTYLKRAAYIANNAADADVTFVNGLDDAERKLLNQIKECRNGVRKWEERKR